MRWISQIHANDVFWDIGANVGLYSIYAARLGVGNILAVEPSVFNLQALATNIHLNSVADKVTIVPFALSNVVRDAVLNLSTTQIGAAHSAFGPPVNQWGDAFTPIVKYQVAGSTLDELARTRDQQPTHLKIDVDGIEHLILEGGAQVLRTVQSCLVELNEADREQRHRATRCLEEAGLYLNDRHDIGVDGMMNHVWSRA